MGGSYLPAGQAPIVLASACGVVFGGAAALALLAPQIGPLLGSARRIGPMTAYSRSRRAYL
jgi:hypothetical protein